MNAPGAIIAVAAGGGLGALARYGLSQWALRAFGPGFPWGVFAANIVGSFLMGLAVSVIASRPGFSEPLRAFLTVGFLGAFTTFSTFSMDFVSLVERKAHLAAVGYLAGSVGLSIAALVAGLVIGRALT